MDDAPVRCDDADPARAPLVGARRQCVMDERRLVEPVKEGGGRRHSLTQPMGKWFARAYSALVSYGLREFDGVRIELCDECGFDERELGDLGTAFAQVYASLQHLERHHDAD